MKVIVIQNSDAKNLLKQLELAKFQQPSLFTGREAISKMTEDEARAHFTTEIHRAFHYVVTRWLQEQGADV